MATNLRFPTQNQEFILASLETTAATNAVLTLCATGLAMGVVHVLTGADHLSAIATLSVNVGDFRAFWYGVRWGIGHSIGLIVVGSVFIVLENVNYRNSGSLENNSSRVIEIPEKLERLAACFVGLFMLALGFYNLYLAHARRRKTAQAIPQRHCHHRHCDNLHDDQHDRSTDLSCDSLTASNASLRKYGDRSNDHENHSSPAHLESTFVQDPSMDSMGIDNNKNNDGEGPVSRKILSLWVGIFHGVAGPGGVLGVVPAVRLHNLWHSVAYLGSFCFSSIAVMGTFAALYGAVSAKWTQDNDRLAYGMEVFSASLSVLVGCTWLVLLYLGILDQVFP